MRTLQRENIIALLTTGPVSGGQLVEKIIADTQRIGKSTFVTVPLLNIRHFDKESITDSGIATLRDGLRARLPDEFPDGVKEVHLYYSTSDENSYVALVNEGGKYSLKKD